MEKVQDHIYALILCGGSGTRLWPYSREKSPKQFLRLFGGKSLFELSLERAKSITSPDKIIIVTTATHAVYVHKHATGVLPENIIVEPFRRETAMAIGIGTTYAKALDPQSVVVNLASDHLISPVSVFSSQIKRAAQLAFENNFMVTIGIRPTFPNTGMGHIKAVKPWSSDKKVLRGEKFVEKPEYKLAEKYTQSGHYFWNTNLFVFKSKLYLDLLKKYSPKTYTFLPKIALAIGTEQEKPLIKHAYQMAPSVAVDYAVAEKLRKFICLPAEFNWTDVGDWKVAWDNLPKDDLGNSILGNKGKGKYIGLNSQNNLLILDKKLIATTGVSDMIIIDTPEALLICPKKDSQSVKQIVKMLEEQKLNKYL